jgi:hypothetical protein
LHRPLSFLVLVLLHAVSAQATTLPFSTQVESTGKAADTIYVCNVGIAQLANDPSFASNVSAISFHSTLDPTSANASLVSPASGWAWLDPQNTGSLVVDDVTFNLASSNYTAAYAIQLCGTSGEALAGSVYDITLQLTPTDLTGGYVANSGVVGAASLGSGPGTPFAFNGPSAFDFPLSSGGTVTESTSLTASGTTGMFQANLYFFERSGTTRAADAENTRTTCFFQFTQR